MIAVAIVRDMVGDPTSEDKSVRRLHIKNLLSNALSFQPQLWLFLKELWRMRRSREAEEVLVPFLVRPNAVAIDVGANRGIYTKLLLARTPNVICIEPNPENSRLLERLYGKQIRVISGAASNRNTDVSLRIPDVDAGYATIEESNSSFSDACKTILVKAYRIDDLKLENVSFIKIDVEGHELSVLEGALEMLRSNRPSILLEAEERHRPRAVATVRELLEPLGYEGYMLQEGALVSIRSFDPSVHQSAEEAHQRLLTGRHEKIYINNFIFLPTVTLA